MNYKDDDLFEIVGVSGDYEKCSGEIVTIFGVVKKGDDCGCGYGFYSDDGALLNEFRELSDCNCLLSLRWKNLRKIDRNKFKESDAQINKIFNGDHALAQS